MPQVVYGYYGKLPVSPEFLRLHASGPELRWLDEWLQQGILYAKAQEGLVWPERIAHASPCGFFYVPRHEGRVVCGVMIASQDRAGRSFPFLRYGLFEREGFAAAPWLIPVAMGQFVHDTTLAVRKLHEGRDWEAFRRTADDGTTEEPSLARAQDTFDSFKGMTKVRQWCFGEVTGVGEAQQLVADHLFTRVVEARRQGKQGLQFPIGLDGSGNNLDLAFWLELTLRPQRREANQDGTGSLCFWRRDTVQHHGTALLSIGPGSPNVVRFLANSEAQDDAWWDLAAPIPDSALAKVEGAAQTPHFKLETSLATVAQCLRDQMGYAVRDVDRVRPESAKPSLLSLVVL